MTGTATAAVEVLTAEVRVLMVGSRQVTLSVARQLDIASPAEIEAFGRIRADHKAPEDRIEVIGSAAGTLARSQITPQTFRCDGPYRGNGFRTPEGGWVAYQRCDSWRADPGHRENHDYVEFGDHGMSWDGEEIYLQWARLPLVVLAGLR
jgi:hypothetical protein